MNRWIEAFAVFSLTFLVVSWCSHIGYQSGYQEGSRYTAELCNRWQNN